MAATNGHSNNTMAMSMETMAIHADDHASKTTDIAPPLHVSTTYHYSNDPAELMPISEQKSMKEMERAPDEVYYSRLNAPNYSRLEITLSAILNGRALLYSSGLSSFHGMLVYLNPKVIAIGDGYHGCHGVISILSRLTGLKKVDLYDEAAWDAAGLGKGDVVHIETPLNPTGEACNIEHYAELAHKRGAYLTVDATFGPPGLQDPFKHHADIVMHSATKYIGGHSDMLCGVLAVKSAEMWRGLFMDRYILGSVMGNMEGWLGLRSVRTLELRVMRQSENADNLVAWFDGILSGSDKSATDTSSEAVKKACLRVQHASLQKQDMHWLKKQMPNGFGPVFALWMQSEDLARKFPSKLRLFHHATSLGGVESLIEWRKMSDSAIDPRVLRVSVGIESWMDLKHDIIAGCEALVK